MKFEFWKDRVEIEKEGMTVETLKNCIFDLCDLDYNGSNGEDYFKDISKEEYDELKSHNYDVFCGDGIYSVSYLDYMWHKETKNLSEEEILSYASNIIESIIRDNYDNDDSDYAFAVAEVVDTSKNIVVIIGYATYI